MKAMKLFVFAAGILLMGFLNSCQSSGADKDYAVTISFNKTSAVDSVFSTDTCTLQGKVVAEGPIQSVRFYRSHPSNSTLTDSIVSLEIDSTQMMNVNSDTCSFSIKVPNITYATTVNVVVTETNGHMVCSKFRINVRTQNVVKYKNVNLGGWNGAGKSGIDLETCTMYGCGTATQAAAFSVEDIYFDYAQFSASDLDGVLHYNGVPRFTDLGSRFALTTITPAQFDTYKSDDAFKSMTPNLLTITIHVGDVILFQTNGGKKGLIKIISLDKPDGDTFFDYIIQK